MARITVEEAQAWVEGTKFTISDPFSATDASLLVQIEEEIIARIANSYADVYASWTNSANTPLLVKVAIAKMFVAWMYRRQYSEDLPDDDAVYASKLEANAQAIVDGIVDGTLDIPALASGSGPEFYPTDSSSAMTPTRLDPSLGPAKFSMGMTF